MSNKRTFTLDDLKNSKCAALNMHLFDQKTSATNRKSKYGNSKVEVDGQEFHSIKEANRYKELKFLLKTGEIGLLRTQVPYELNEGGSHSLIYIADFVYLSSDSGETIVEDTKGFKTKEYIKKRKLMKKVYGITIKET